MEDSREIDPELFSLVSQNMELATAQRELDVKIKNLIDIALDTRIGAGEIQETPIIAYMVAANKTLIASLSAFEK